MTKNEREIPPCHPYYIPGHILRAGGWQQRWDDYCPAIPTERPMTFAVQPTTRSVPVRFLTNGAHGRCLAVNTLILFVYPGAVWPNWQLRTREILEPQVIRHL